MLFASPLMDAWKDKKSDDFAFSSASIFLFLPSFWSHISAIHHIKRDNSGVEKKAIWTFLRVFFPPHQSLIQFQSRKVFDTLKLFPFENWQTYFSLLHNRQTFFKKIKCLISVKLIASQKFLQETSSCWKFESFSKNFTSILNSNLWPSPCPELKQSTQIKTVQMLCKIHFTEYFNALFQLIFNNVSASLLNPKHTQQSQTHLTMPEIARQQKLKALKIKLLR